MMPIKELRVVLTVHDHEQAVTFYREVLGLPQLADWSGDQGNVVLLDGGHATLELVDASQAAFIDQIEVGRRSAGPVRLAISVEDVDIFANRGATAGVEPLGDAVDTPWGDRNIRLSTPDGMQLTLFSSPGE
jgi:catechol 2,3-dioxygenase-like lactoylglutathione lyase family enzyme